MTEIKWIALAALGLFHGLNPAMGWLFALSRGLQDGGRATVLRSIGAVAVGHALAVGVVVALFGAVGRVLSPGLAAAAGAAVMIALGLFKLLGLFKVMGLFKLIGPPAHAHRAGTRIGGNQIAFWSFLMATGHGAGLMLLPALGGAAVPAQVSLDPHVAAAGLAASQLGPALLGVTVHSAAMLAAGAAVALAVRERVGVAILRRGWPSADLVWALALVAGGLYLAVVALAVVAK